MATDEVARALDAMPNVTVKKRIKPGSMAPFANGSSSSLDVFLVEASAEHGAHLMATAGPGVTVELNHPLKHMAEMSPAFAGPTPILAPLDATALTGLDVPVRVVDGQGNAVENAMVTAYLDNFQQIRAATGSDGIATLTFFGGTVSRIMALYVKPFANFWERWIPSAALNPSGPNVVTLQPLSQFTSAGFVTNQTFFGWGEKLMGLDASSASTITGRRTDGTRIKVAIIDSGCDNTHPALQHITLGQDLVGSDTANGWKIDSMSHGTHCAGVIAGSGANGIRGFVPDAEVHILKLFPDGGFDALLVALAYCVANEIDVVNCSLGGDIPSPQVVQRIAFAHSQGTAVFVAAGNEGGAVQFPASVPGVLAVSAIGQVGDYPQDTYHAQTYPKKSMSGVNVGNNNVFAPTFTCFGPEIRVCAPGVAVISSVPNGGYAAWDGTSMACPHVTGLAAAILAHHPALSTQTRNATRVDQLFQVLGSSAIPVGLAPAYSGNGLPALNGGAAHPIPQPQPVMPLMPQNLFAWNPAAASPPLGAWTTFASPQGATYRF